jgi:hypothetical protein
MGWEEEGETKIEKVCKKEKKNLIRRQGWNVEFPILVEIFLRNFNSVGRTAAAKVLAPLFRLLGGHAFEFEFESGCHYSLLIRPSADRLLSVACHGLSVMRHYEDVRRKVWTAATKYAPQTTKTLIYTLMT